jgi:hypothetical protein
MTKSNLNLKWFINNHEMLIDRYRDKFVAIDDERVVDSEMTLNELLNRLRRNGQYTNSMLIQFIHDRNTKFTI